MPLIEHRLLKVKLFIQNVYLLKKKKKASLRGLKVKHTGNYSFVKMRGYFLNIAFEGMRSILFTPHTDSARLVAHSEDTADLTILGSRTYLTPNSEM